MVLRCGIPTGEGPGGERPYRGHASCLSVFLDLSVRQRQRRHIGWAVGSKPLASVECANRVLLLRRDRIDSPNKPSASYWIYTGLTGFGIHVCEQPIDFSLDETF